MPITSAVLLPCRATAAVTGGLRAGLPALAASFASVVLLAGRQGPQQFPLARRSPHGRHQCFRGFEWPSRSGPPLFCDP